MDQLGFDALLTEADTTNKARLFDRAAAHLPGEMQSAIPFFRALLEDHHAAMIAADVARVTALREEARLLAIKLNGGKSFGVIADDDAPGCVLARETAAATGVVPIWGQQGTFEITVSGARVQIEMEGLFGIASSSHWLGFSAHAVNWDRPFISETGYRSFLGCAIEITPGVTPDAFCARIIETHVAREMNGRLIDVAGHYRNR